MSTVLYETNNHIATLIINRPERRNALNAETISELLVALRRAETDTAVRALVLTGAGDRAFCAGADLGSGVGKGGTAEYATLLKRIVHFPKPTIAKVHGYCLAGGMGLMLACDIVVAAEDAQFGTPEVNVGIWPMMIGALIFRNMLPKHAMPMILLGERFGAERAQEMGFVSQVVSVAGLDATVQTMAEKIAAKSPIGIKIGKEAFYQMQAMPFDDALDFLSEKLTEVAHTEDAKEGIAAFLEKRAPNFTGQ